MPLYLLGLALFAAHWLVLLAANVWMSYRLLPVALVLLLAGCFVSLVDWLLERRAAAKALSQA